MEAILKRSGGQLYIDMKAKEILASSLMDPK